MRKTFKKEERLCSTRLIEELFHKGSSFVVYPFRIVFLQVVDPLPMGVQVILSVSKRKYKRAHDRNAIKRKMREVYRLQKDDLLYPQLQSKSINLLMAIQYIANEDLAFEQYFTKMNKTLNQVVDAVS